MKSSWLREMQEMELNCIECGSYRGFRRSGIVRVGMWHNVQYGRPIMCSMGGRFRTKIYIRRYYLMTAVFSIDYSPLFKLPEPHRVSDNYFLAIVRT